MCSWWYQQHIDVTGGHEIKRADQNWPSQGKSVQCAYSDRNTIWKEKHEIGILTFKHFLCPSEAESCNGCAESGVQLSSDNVSSVLCTVQDFFHVSMPLTFPFSCLEIKRNILTIYSSYCIWKQGDNYLEIMKPAGIIHCLDTHVKNNWNIITVVTSWCWLLYQLK